MQPTIWFSPITRESPETGTCYSLEHCGLGTCPSAFRAFLFLRGEHKGNWRSSPEGGSQGSEEKRDQCGKGRNTNYVSWFSLVPSICFKCICSTYTVGRWFLGERTAHQKNVWSGRSSSPSLKQVPTSLVPQAATSPTKLAEAPQIPGVTNCLLSVSSAPGIRSSSRACRAKPKEVP